MMHLIKTLATALLVVGGLNWGLIAVLDMDIVQTLFGNFELVPEVIYSLVGISAIYYILEGKILDNDG